MSHEDDAPASAKLENDAELSSWSEDWKSETRGPAAVARALSAEAAFADKVLAESARGARMAKLAWAGQIASLLIAVFVFLALVIKTRSVMQAVLAAVVLPTLLGLFGFFVHIRQSIGTNADESVASFVALTTRRREADVRLMKGNRIGLGFLSAVFWVWFPLFVFSRAERFGAEPWRLAVGALSSLVVFGGAYWYVGRRVRRAENDLLHWKKVAQSFEENP